jgi:hypothetical protein
VTGLGSAMKQKKFSSLRNIQSPSVQSAGLRS